MGKHLPQPPTVPEGCQVTPYTVHPPLRRVPLLALARCALSCPCQCGTDWLCCGRGARGLRGQPVLPSRCLEETEAQGAWAPRQNPMALVIFGVSKSTSWAGSAGDGNKGMAPPQSGPLAGMSVAREDRQAERCKRGWNDVLSHCKRVHTGLFTLKSILPWSGEFLQKGCAQTVTLAQPFLPSGQVCLPPSSHLCRPAPGHSLLPGGLEAAEYEGRKAAGRPLSHPLPLGSPGPSSSGPFGAPDLGWTQGHCTYVFPTSAPPRLFLPAAPPPSSPTASGPWVFPALCPPLSIFFISFSAPSLWCVQRVSEAHPAPSVPGHGAPEGPEEWPKAE